MTTIKRRYDELIKKWTTCDTCVSRACRICYDRTERHLFSPEVAETLDHIKALEDAYFGAPEKQPATLREAIRQLSKASTSSEALKHVLPSVAIRENADRIAEASEILTEHLPSLDKDAYILSAYMRDSGAVFFVKVGGGGY